MNSHSDPDASISEQFLKHRLNLLTKNDWYRSSRKSLCISDASEAKLFEKKCIHTLKSSRVKYCSILCMDSPRDQAILCGGQIERIKQEALYHRMSSESMVRSP